MGLGRDVSERRLGPNFDMVGDLVGLFGRSFECAVHAKVAVASQITRRLAVLVCWPGVGSPNIGDRAFCFVTFPNDSAGSIFRFFGGEGGVPMGAISGFCLPVNGAVCLFRF